MSEFNSNPEANHIKILAADLRVLLNGLGCSIGLCQSLNLAASLPGFKNWHEASASYESGRKHSWNLLAGLERVSTCIGKNFDFQISAKSLSEQLDLEWASADSGSFKSFFSLPLLSDVAMALEIEDGGPPPYVDMADYAGPTSKSEILSQSAMAAEVVELRKMARVLGFGGQVVVRTSETSRVYGHGDFQCLTEVGQYIFALQQSAGPAREKINNLRQEFANLAVDFSNNARGENWARFLSFSAINKFCGLNLGLPQRIVFPENVAGFVGNDWWGLGVDATNAEMSELAQKLLEHCADWEQLRSVSHMAEVWFRQNRFTTAAQLNEALGRESDSLFSLLKT